MSDGATRRPSAQEQDTTVSQGPVEPPPLDLEVAKLTDVGRARPHNEDYVDFYIPPDPRQLVRKGAMYLVADGMGGHQAGEVASQGAVEVTIGQYYGDVTHDIGTSLVRAFRMANQQIYEQAQADPSKGGMGTTLVAAVILGRRVYVANVGDSRAYLINMQGITQITEDHSWVEEQVRAGLLTPEQALRHPQRNLVTRALGSKPDVQVDLFEGELNAGDTLLLCSDGLTGRVQDHELAAAVHEHPPQEAVRLLVALANERGGNDNISVLVVSAQEEAATVKAPVLALAEQKPVRKSRLLPALAGMAALVVLALGVLVGLRVLLPSRDRTPTPSVVASPAIPTDVLTPDIGLSPTTGVVVTSAQTVTASPTWVVSPTVTLAPQETLMPESTEPESSATDSPQPPTDTPLPPTATPKPESPAPTLVAPTQEAVIHGLVTFRWDYPLGQLGPERAFQVLIWREGASAHNGAAEAVRAFEQTINLDDLLQGLGGEGSYLWSVVVVRKENAQQRLSLEAPPWPFSYSGPQQPTAKSTDVPSEKPTASGGIGP